MTGKHSNVILVAILIGLLCAALFVFGGSRILPRDLFVTLLGVCDVLGQFFLLGLRMIIVPLVMASVVMGITSLGDVRKIGGIGLRTLGFYAATTALAVALGVLIVTLLQPGAGMGDLVTAGLHIDEQRMADIRAKEDIGFGDLLLSFLSRNIVESLASGDMLPVIVFSLILGAILTTLGERGKPLIACFDGLNEAMMKFIGLVLWIAPVGIFGLVSAKFGAATIEEGGLGRMIGSVGKYSATILIALGIHGFVTLPLLCAFLARRNPLKYAGHMMPALLTAWSTATSSGTLPVTMECAEERAGVDPRAAGFVLPLGATINMDGTALYEAVAVIFIAQAYGIDLTFVQLLVVFVTATLASIGAAGVPQAGLVMMVIVLNAVGLPVEGIGLILAVDWFLDRFRTAINVWGDSIGAAYIDGRLRNVGPGIR
ncbi:MAG: solute carrier family 1 (neuronal/epithelial high affinity glutamate transporter), er 1 [Candidatus Sumerlaeota bacterium]|nr:solute carrier family 1 (neuronal/epithelial high affinity glutamate transporter), er 1 [Candidatus Sumerlaeota bacterium]